MNEILDRRLEEVMENNGKIIISYSNGNFFMVNTLDLDAYELRENYFSVTSGGFTTSINGKAIYDDEEDEFIFCVESGEYVVGFTI